MPKSKVAVQNDVQRLLELRNSSGKDHPLDPDLEQHQEMPRGRRGLKGVVVYLTPAAKETLVRISRRERKTVNDLGREAMNLLFSNRGEKPLA